MGHWENTNLNKDQCMYAATDAFVSIFLKSIIYWSSNILTHW